MVVYNYTYVHCACIKVQRTPSKDNLTPQRYIFHSFTESTVLYYTPLEI